MIEVESQALFDRFIDRTLPKPAWDHRAHLLVCWVTLQDRSAPEAVDFLRGAIRSYNEATGVTNTSTSGYHETLTRYFVDAVADLDASFIDEVLRAPSCQVDAPLSLWSRQVLFSQTARAVYVEPDLESTTDHSD